MSALIVLAGCTAKYKNGKVWARETFSEAFGCDYGRVMPRELEMGFAVDGCGITALCDIVRGEWQCNKVDPPHLRAWNRLLTQTSCTGNHVVPTRQTTMTPAETVVQLDACGTLYSCNVNINGGVTCGPMAAEESGAPVPMDAPVSMPSQPQRTETAPPPPPPPTPAASGGEECVPKCRSGFICHRGTCVSACNPPCAAGERCTAEGECVKK